MSWNVSTDFQNVSFFSSASSWGCELKCSWNCTGKDISGQPLREAVSWNDSDAESEVIYQVSLFVRLWVEMSIISIASSEKRVSLFVRLWVEMIYASWGVQFQVVSLFVRLWVEMLVLIVPARRSASASSWGCELKWTRYKGWPTLLSQPLREAVSWNSVHPCGITPNLSSASSWGCELK